MIDSGESKLPLQYEDGPDYCTVRDAQGRDFALTMQPDLMKAMERALSAEITSFMRDPTKDQKNVWRALQYEIEGVILRRLHAKRIEGYTLEMSQELTALYFAFRPDKVALTTPTIGENDGKQIGGGAGPLPDLLKNVGSVSPVSS